MHPTRRESAREDRVLYQGSGNLLCNILTLCATSDRILAIRGLNVKDELESALQHTMRILERWFGTEEKPHRQMYIASIRMLHNWVNNTSDATHSKLLEQEVKTSESAPSNVLHTMHSKFAQVSRTTKHFAQLVPAKNWNLTNLNVSCYFPSTLSTLSYRLPALCSFYLKMFR